jgi:hypothetical protein
LEQARRNTRSGRESLFYGHIGNGNEHIVIYQPGAAPLPKA